MKHGAIINLGEVSQDYRNGALSKTSHNTSITTNSMSTNMITNITNKSASTSVTNNISPRVASPRISCCYLSPITRRRSDMSTWPNLTFTWPNLTSSSIWPNLTSTWPVSLFPLVPEQFSAHDAAIHNKRKTTENYGLSGNISRQCYTCL